MGKVVPHARFTDAHVIRQQQGTVRQPRLHRLKAGEVVSVTVVEKEKIDGVLKSTEHLHLSLIHI